MIQYHLAGTAKMGDPADPTTVVDPELRYWHKSLKYIILSQSFLI